MSDTESPQGIAAVCRVLDLPLDDVLADLPTDALVCVLTNVRDPGNAGTVIRGADAAGADAVIVSDASVDVYNSKVVRSTVGSLWHLPLVVGSSVPEILQALRERGRQAAGRRRRRHRRCCHDADLAGAARLGDGQRGLGPARGGARRLRRRRPGPHPRPRGVPQPRHGGDGLPLRLGGGPPHEPLTALSRRLRGYPPAMTSRRRDRCRRPGSAAATELRRPDGRAAARRARRRRGDRRIRFVNAEALRILDCDAPSSWAATCARGCRSRQVRPRLVGAHRPVERPRQPPRSPREAPRRAHGARTSSSPPATSGPTAPHGRAGHARSA